MGYPAVPNDELVAAITVEVDWEDVSWAIWGRVEERNAAIDGLEAGWRAEPQLGVVARVCDDVELAVAIDINSDQQSSNTTYCKFNHFSKL